MKRLTHAAGAPAPAGHYSQAIEAGGPLLFVSGQTARLPDGTRLSGVSFEQEAHQVMENLRTIAAAAGYDLATQCVQMTVFLRDLGDSDTFDRVMAAYLTQPPTRALVGANLRHGALQVQAVFGR